MEREIAILVIEAITMLSIISAHYIVLSKKEGDIYERTRGSIIFTIIISISLFFVFRNPILKVSYLYYLPTISIVSYAVFVYLLHLNRNTTKSLPRNLIYISISIPFLITVITGILFFNNKSSYISQNGKPLNLAKVEESIVNVRNKFDEIENSIQVESNNINDLFDEVKKEISIKTMEVNNMAKREEELKNQIEYYKRLESISEEQAAAINKALNADNSLNQILSFIMGFLSSLLVWILSQTKFMKRLFLPKTVVGKIQNDN